MPKNKGQLIAELVSDAYRELKSTASCTIPDTKVSVLAAALDVFSRGSKYRQDAIEIVKGCYPKYYDDPLNSQIKEDDEENWIFSVERYLEKDNLWMGCGTCPTWEKANAFMQNEQTKTPAKYRIVKWHVPQ